MQLRGYSLLQLFYTSSLAPEWTENSLVPIAQTLASFPQLTECWMCLPRDEPIIDDSNPTVHLVKSFNQVPRKHGVPKTESWSQPARVLLPFCCSRKAKNPGQNQIYGAQCGHLSSSWERIWNSPRPLITASLWVTSGPQSLDSVSPHFLNLPFGSLAASGLSFTQCPPLPLVHFPLLKSLFSSVFSFQDSGPRQVQHHPSHLEGPALWLALCSLLPLMGDRQRRERLASPRTDLGPAGSP